MTFPELSGSKLGEWIRSLKDHGFLRWMHISVDSQRQKIFVASSATQL